MSRLGLVILATDDVERAERFWTRAFGWPVAVRVPPYRELALPDGMRLGLYQRDGFGANTGATAARPPPIGTTATELYVVVEDLASAVAALREAGATELSAAGPRAWGDTVAYFADPDGNVVAVAVGPEDP